MEELHVLVIQCISNEVKRRSIDAKSQMENKLGELVQI